VNVPTQQVPAVLITFDRWFLATGKPAHHKAGMKAFLKGGSQGKKTLAAWNELMSRY
jgi:hypothetical protein